MENFKLHNEKENKLFKRREVVFDVHSRASPSHLEVRKFISEKFSSPKENIKIKSIMGNFGSNEFTVSANIYSSKEDREKTEKYSKKDEKRHAAEAGKESESVVGNKSEEKAE